MIRNAQKQGRSLPPERGISVVLHTLSVNITGVSLSAELTSKDSGDRIDTERVNNIRATIIFI